MKSYFCHNCGSEIKPNAKFCTKCGSKIENKYVYVQDLKEEVSNYSYKNPWIALILSLLIIGAGQFYNGEYKKGFSLLAMGIIGASFTAGGMWLVAAIYSAVDAFVVANKKRRR